MTQEKYDQYVTRITQSWGIMPEWCKTWTVELLEDLKKEIDDC